MNRSRIKPQLIFTPSKKSLKRCHIECARFFADWLSSSPNHHAEIRSSCSFILTNHLTGIYHTSRYILAGFLSAFYTTPDTIWAPILVKSRWDHPWNFESKSQKTKLKANFCSKFQENRLTPTSKVWHTFSDNDTWEANVMFIVFCRFGGPGAWSSQFCFSFKFSSFLKE